MLVLTRHNQEVILIGDDIKIKILEIRRGQVRLGITAPNLPVHREEVYEDIKRSGTKSKSEFKRSHDNKKNTT